MIPSPFLIFTIFAHGLFGSYMEIATVIASKISTPLEHFINQSVFLHYGISFDEAGIIKSFAFIDNLNFIGSIVATLMFVSKIDSWGRKTTSIYFGSSMFIIAGVCLIVGFYLTLIEVAAFGFFFFGIGKPLRLSITKLYVGECAPDEIRGFAILAVMVISKFAGTCYQFLALEQILGTDSRWILLAMLMIILSIIYIIVGYFIPESPKFMRMKNKDENEIINTIKMYQGKSVDPIAVLYNVDKEISLTQNYHYSIRELFSDSALFNSLKIIFISTITFCVGTTRIMGVNSIILKIRYGFSNADAVFFDFICGFICFPLNLFIPFLIEKVGRRPLILSAIMMNCISSIIMFFTQFIYSIAGPNLLTIILAGIFTIMDFLMSSMGVGIFGIILIADLLPVNAKISATQISILSGNIVSIIVNFYFSTFDPILGAFVHVPFVILQLFFFIYLWNYLPETKQKPVYENYKEIKSRSSSLQDPFQSSTLNSSEDKQYGTFD